MGRRVMQRPFYFLYSFNIAKGFLTEAFHHSVRNLLKVVFERI